MTAAAVILDVAAWYVWIGAAVAAVFLTIGMDRIDEDARGAYAFRPLLVPGVLLIWPLVLWRWYRWETAAEAWQRRYSPPRASHTAAALAMAAVILVTLAVSLSIRQPWPAATPPVQLSAPADAGEAAQ